MKALSLILMLYILAATATGKTPKSKTIEKPLTPASKNVPNNPTRDATVGKIPETDNGPYRNGVYQHWDKQQQEAREVQKEKDQGM